MGHTHNLKRQTDQICHVYPEQLPDRRLFLTRLGAIPIAIGASSIARRSFAHFQVAKTSCNWPTSTSISPSGASNQIVALPYGDGTYIEAKIVFNVDASGVALKNIFDGGKILPNNDTVITNLGSSYATVLLPDYRASGISKSIPPRKATIIRSEAVIRKASAEETPSKRSTEGPVHLAFIRTVSPRNIANALSNPEIWQSYTSAGCWPSTVGPYPLWMSKRAVMTNLKLSFDPWEAANQATPEGKGAVDFSINSNMWWLPAMSDAAIHHCHYKNFIEVHTQLFGVGRMQKFDDRKARVLDCSNAGFYPFGTTNSPPPSGYYGVPGTAPDTSSFGAGMYEEYRLAPGDTNVPFPYVDKDMNFLYPWHQYYSDTDCLWVVWELIPTS